MRQQRPRPIKCDCWLLVDSMVTGALPQDQQPPLGSRAWISRLPLVRTGRRDDFNSQIRLLKYLTSQPIGNTCYDRRFFHKCCISRLC